MEEERPDQARRRLGVSRLGRLGVPRLGLSRSGRGLAGLRRRWWLVVLGAVLLAAVAGALAVLLMPGDHRPTLAEGGQVSAAYLRAWQQRDWQAMARLVDRPPPDFGARHQTFLSGLAVTSATYTAGPTTSVGGPGTAFTAHLDLAGLGAWEYEGRVPLVLVHNTWRVEWSPGVIEPALAGGGTVTRT